MYFGTRHGVSRYCPTDASPDEGARFINFVEADGLLCGWVKDIYRDNGGVMWFATGSGVPGLPRGGISCYDEGCVISFTTKDGLQDNRISALCLDSEARLWVGTQNGYVHRYEAGRFNPLKVGQGDDPPRISSICQDVNGEMWVGTGGAYQPGQGVLRYNGHEMTCLSASDGLPNDTVYSICSAPDGMVWFGTIDGPAWYDERQSESVVTVDELTGQICYSVNCDAMGNVWCGCTRGLARYDDHRFTFLSSEAGDVPHRVTGMCDAKDGSIWMTTWSDGVFRYDGKRFTAFTQKDGLAQDRTWAVHQSDDGVLWFATDDGVSLYDGVAWSSLDTRDGLAGVSVFAIQEDADGAFWFATDTGLTRYHRSLTRPKVRITSVQTDEMYTEFDALPALITDTRITIRYTAIDFKTAADKRQYRIRIDGLDNDWRSPTWVTEFDGIFDTPGTYTFFVQAIDRDLNYSEPASLTLTFITDPRDQQIAELESDLEKRNRELEAELRDAHDVQMSLMPESTPESDFFEIFGKCMPARLVSGDFFTYIDGGTSNEIGIVVADAMGKAMKAAMNAVLTDGVLHTVARNQSQLSLPALLSEVNDTLVERLEEIMNITMVIGLINTQKKTLTLANAGHHAYPLLVRDGTVSSLVAKGMPLGVIASIPYRDVEFSLQSGDVIVFMSDGIFEAEDSFGNLYSTSGRLKKTVSGFTNDLPTTEMVESIINDAIAYSEGKAHEKDDMTVVALKVK